MSEHEHPGEPEPIVLHFEPRPRRAPPAGKAAREPKPEVIFDATGRPDLLRTLQRMMDVTSKNAGDLELEARRLRSACGSIKLFGDYVATEATAATMRGFVEALADTVNAWRDAAIEWKRSQS